MTTLMALLPVAISALIGALAGFRYARKERAKRERERHREDEKQHDFPFMTAAR